MQENTFATASSVLSASSATTEATPLLAKNGRQYGPYTLIREAGRGAAATVYEAIDERIGRTVAIKILERSHGAGLPSSLSHSDNRLRDIERFQREARAVARLSHPSIVSVFDVGEQNGEHFIVMEFVEGVSLRERLDQGRFSLNETCQVIRQIASAVDAIHSQNIIHRDLKPSNIMLLPDGRIKLLDFGVALNADDATLTVAGALIGSPAYMSPEQIRGEPPTAAVDIWALGVLAYEMIAGTPPFAGPNLASVLYRITNEPAMALSGESVAVDAVIRRALDRDPKQRFGTAEELAQALTAASASAVPTYAPTLLMPSANEEANPTPDRNTLRLPSWRAISVVSGGVALAALAIALKTGLTPTKTVPAPLPSPLPAPHQETQPVAIATSQLLAASVPSVLKPQSRVVPKTSAPVRRMVAHSHPLPKPTPVPVAATPVRKKAQPTPVAVAAVTSGGQSLLGRWSGNIWKRTATLNVSHQNSETFAGTLTLETETGRQSIPVSGTCSAETGRVAFWRGGEAPATAKALSRFGQQTGRRIDPKIMGGIGLDDERHVYTWSFSR